MSLIHAQPWEMRLLFVAREALNSQALHHHVQADKAVLDAAYRYCDAITYQHSRTFYLCSACALCLLPYH
jgi:hypothetical protein